MRTLLSRIVATVRAFFSPECSECGLRPGGTDACDTCHEYRLKYHSF